MKYPPHTPPFVIEACDAIEKELDWFQWCYPDGSDNRGEVSIDTETYPAPKWLRLDVWVRDNEDPDDDTIKPLMVHIDVTPIWRQAADEQIRSVIHAFLTHEADEQMFFGQNREMRFDPHANEKVARSERKGA